MEPDHSPLYYLSLHFWQLVAGGTEFGVRYLSVLAGTLWIPLVYWLGRRLRMPFAALAALLLVLSPFAYYYAQETRDYAIAAVFSTLSIGAFAVAVSRNRSRDWVLWILASLLAVAWHYYVVWLFAALGVWFLVNPGRAKGRWMPFIVSNGAILVTLLLLAGLVYQRIAGYTLYQSGRPNVFPVLAELVFRAFTFGPRAPLVETSGQLWADLAWLLPILAAGSFLVWRRLAHRASDRNFESLPLITLGVVALCSYLLQLRLPWFFPRYILYVLPLAIFLILQAAVWSAKRPALAALLLLPITGLNVYGLWQGWFNPDWERDNYRLVTAAIRDGMGLREKVVINSATFNPAFDRYWPNSRPEYQPSSLPIDTTATGAALEQLTSDASGVWLFQWSSPISDPDGYVGRWLESHGSEIQTRWFGEITLRHFAIQPGRPAPPANKAGVSFEGLRLSGYDGFSRAKRGGDLKGTLSWITDTPTPHDWTRSLRLMDLNGRRVAQLDEEPLGGTIGTSEWRARETVLDEARLRIPTDVQPGTYQLVIGLYEQGGAIARSSDGSDFAPIASVSISD
jgi:hypothetical protein